jgi:hypothetical protein
VLPGPLRRSGGHRPSRNDDTLIALKAYVQVTELEDRLFVPAECVPLFVENGWYSAR